MVSAFVRRRSHQQEHDGMTLPLRNPPPMRLDGFIPLKSAVHMIGTTERPVTDHAVRQSVLRLKAYHRDEDGRIWVPRKLAEIMALFYRTTGYLLPRGTKSMAEIPEIKFEPETAK
jgi:hypothetical protein